MQESSRVRMHARHRSSTLSFLFWPRRRRWIGLFINKPPVTVGHTTGSSCSCFLFEIHPSKEYDYARDVFKELESSRVYIKLILVDNPNTFNLLNSP